MSARFTDAEHAAIVAVWCAGGTWREACEQLGLAGSGDRGVTCAARNWLKLVAAKGGWWCPVYPRLCTICGGPLLARQPGQTTHAGRCRRRNQANLAKESRVQRGYTSTQDVRRWRQTNPGRDLALRIRERFKPPQPVALTPEQKRRHSRQAIANRQRITDDLRQTADNLGAPWSSSDDAWLIEHQDWSSTAAAGHLNRTPSAVLKRRGALRRRGLLPPRGRQPVETVQVAP